MPAAGLEPARGRPRQILSLMRLPFRHAGLLTQQKNYIISAGRLQAVFSKSGNQKLFLGKLLEQLLKALHRLDRVLVVVEGGQTEVILSVLAKACTRGSDNLSVV